MVADNLFSVAGKVCLVTGVSSGLGLHFAKTFAKHGAKVAVASRRIDRLDALVEDLKAGGVAGMSAVRMDVRDETSILIGVKQVEESLRPIDVLVNTANANVYKPALEQTKGLSSYCASKAGVTQLTRVLALEWAQYGILVNAICPGPFRTEMTSDLFDTPEGDKFTDTMPMRSLGDPKELQGRLLLTASESSSSYRTGFVVVPDGGSTL